MSDNRHTTSDFLAMVNRCFDPKYIEPQADGTVKVCTSLCSTFIRQDCGKWGYALNLKENWTYDSGWTLKDCCEAAGQAIRERAEEIGDVP